MPVLAVTRTGKIVFGNPAARFFWRLQLERLSDFTIPQLFGEESAIWHHLKRAIQEETSFVIEPYRLEIPDGSPQSLRVQIDPIVLPNEPVEMAVVAFWDLTHRETMETRVREYRLMDTIGIMAKRLAHELQNPLSGVKGAVQLLARHLAKHPDLKEYPAIMEQELGRMERLIRNLLLQGEGQKLKRSHFNIHELLDTVIWFQKSSADGLVIRRDFDPSLPDIYADRDKLHQVFLNLLQNAREAGGDKPITIRTRMSGPWAEQRGLPEPGINFVIEIEDQGPGVAENAIEHLFTPFFSTKNHGTGLGLSISYQILRAHGGVLQHKSAKKNGAIFCAIIPLTSIDITD